MTIQFACLHCGKPLSTGDEKAGLKAKCPGCGEPISVPTINTDGEDLAAVAPPPLPVASGARVKCPMCGHPASAGEKECSACGEPLKTKAGKPAKKRDLGYEPVTFEVGVVLSRTWEIFKQDLGLVVGSHLVVGLLSMAALIPGIGMIVAAVLSADNGGDEQIPLVIALGLFGFLLCIVGYFVIIWLNVGIRLLLLGLVRGQNVSFGTLFEGKKFLWRMFAVSFLYQIMMNIAAQLCYLPALFVAIYFWPSEYLLVDDDSPNIQALLDAPKLASKSAMASFVLMLASLGISILGLLALGVGLIFASPFIALAWCVAYDEMRGGGDFDADEDDMDAEDDEE